jgi:hypothetical protein
MSRQIAVAGAALLSTVVVLGQAPSPRAASAAQGHVSISEEPHHTRLFYTAHLRMFDVTVPPGTVSADYSLDHDLVTVALGAPTPGAIDVITATGSPSVHRVENAGQTPYRMFAVENLRDEGWSMPARVSAPGTTLARESRAFAVYDVRLTAATPRTNHVHAMPTVVMLVAGAVEVQGGGGESEFRMEATGRWFPSMWSQPHSFMLVGSADAHLVEVEAR